MDSDVMPVCNLDYIFDLSDGRDPILKENLVVAWTKEPANGGFFMLKPGKGEHHQLQSIIENQRQRDQSLPFPHFDETKGWGHQIVPPDSWSTMRGEQRRKWDFTQHTRIKDCFTTG